MLSYVSGNKVGRIDRDDAAKDRLAVRSIDGANSYAD